MRKREDEKTGKPEYWNTQHETRNTKHVQRTIFLLFFLSILSTTVYSAEWRVKQFASKSLIAYIDNKKIKSRIKYESGRGVSILRCESIHPSTIVLKLKIPNATEVNSLRLNGEWIEPNQLVIKRRIFIPPGRHQVIELQLNQQPILKVEASFDKPAINGFTIEQLKSFLDTAPYYFPAHSSLIKAYKKKDKLSEGIKYYRKRCAHSLSTPPNFGTVTRSSRSNVINPCDFYALAELYYENPNVDNNEVYWKCQHLIESDVNFAPAYLLLAKIKFQEHRLDEAINYLGLANRYNFQNGFGITGEVEKLRNSIAEKVREKIRQNDQKTIRYANLKFAFQEWDGENGAIDSYKELVIEGRLTQDELDYFLALAYNDMGDRYKCLSKLRELLEKVDTLDVDKKEQVYKLLKCYSSKLTKDEMRRVEWAMAKNYVLERSEGYDDPETEMFDEALLARSFVNLNHDNAEYLNNLACIYAEQGELEKSAMLLRKAMNLPLKGGYRIILENLGKIYEKQGFRELSNECKEIEEALR